MGSEIEAYSAVFLGDRPVPTRLVYLHRAPTKRIGPNRYTGIGGRREPSETIDTTAHRELAEETGLHGLQLTEFARCRVLPPDPRDLHFFFGVLASATPTEASLPSCTDGTLEWVPVAQLLERDLLPTARLVVTEWLRRGLQVDRPWSMLVTVPLAAPSATISLLAEGLQPLTQLGQSNGSS